MKTSSIILAASLAATAVALPAGGGEPDRVVTITVPAPPTAATAAPTWNWREGAVDSYPIHSSCNGTERLQLARALDETVSLARQARDHILRFGKTSSLYSKYFGNASTAEPVGWYHKLVGGDKAGLLFRCDDIDGNCHQEGWGGHWRGENATSETVICPLSYTTRKSLEGLCGFGYTVAAGKLNTFWAGDLMHRIFHLEPVGEGVLEHYADSHAECLELAKSDPAKAARNSHTLQYFALDVYAYDIALPGEGCAGKSPSASSDGGHSTPSPIPASPPTQTSAAPTECHTHADGVVHCS
ncbi:hypothetical protein MCOR27_000210 [Pyricularia oryzae]|uniref:Putative peptidase domain-containing protein n=2 Tax=Pyricularia TaxID=48558 RepID=A0ABQ8P2C0_PYRGI|nr:uncharacterized protein MGG_17123 [Pyricularia oryzae 70-15]KAH8843890.1 hypothetical protein MCOR01_004670 [Pyricularia oryzae]KAI6305023.1 hypothetical protein MCOR33_000142 [Pyricularia grisea]EHA50368.1 hypothetical protein MGG_17123 [Pyricularia oryzae 70-15]KAH9431368.1 hypothetical protein MCOR02_008661 [Pyricularia oryzae]KAI6261928.1 hypothetical protein MCOR19_001877 [Pyricularia oryzae]